MNIRVSFPVVPVGGIALKQLQDSALSALVNFVATGISDGTGTGGVLGQIAAGSPAPAWLFDNSQASSTTYLTTQNTRSPLTVTGSPQSVRVELNGVAAFGDQVSSAGGLFQVINHKEGDATPATWRELSVWTYCNNAQTVSHNGSYWSIAVQNALLGGGWGWNVIKFPAPAAQVFHAVVIEFTCPAKWSVWVDGAAQTITQVVANNMAAVCDDKQYINVGSILYGASGGVFQRDASGVFYGFAGLLRGLNVFLDNGNGTNSVMGQAGTNVLASVLYKSHSGKPPCNIFLYNAAQIIKSAANVTLYSPNIWGEYGMGAQDLQFGSNSEDGVTQINAPARILI